MGVGEKERDGERKNERECEWERERERELRESIINYDVTVTMNQIYLMKSNR